MLTKNKKARTLTKNKYHEIYPKSHFNTMHSAILIYSFGH